MSTRLQHSNSKTTTMDWCPTQLSTCRVKFHRQYSLTDV